MIDWDLTIIKNPRKENGDLGDIKCSVCKNQTGAYIAWDDKIELICKGCLLDAVDAINKAILT